jgi:quinol monooxygenase YgiN
MTILAVSMTIHPGKIEECIRLLKLMRAETLKEPGCLQYDTIQSVENPLQFFFYERYKDDAALEAHRTSAHFAQYITGGVDALVATRTRELYHPVD